mmetsp:Transcript_22039/g.41518  ORF Transcript_22039/g.41518 Transcript_22039/m.41518 type:complete len:336 (-) Transcript_22039:29-1036(-)
MDSPVEVLISLLSGTAVATFAMARSATVHDVKSRLQEEQGTPARKQQLVAGCDVLRNEKSLSELTTSDFLELRLVRKEGIQLHWQAHLGPEDAYVVNGPEWGLEACENVGSRHLGLQLALFPKGFDSTLRRPGTCSVLVRRPKSSILHARVHMSGVTRERLFTSANGTEEGWINFAAQEILPRCGEALDICLEVLHAAVVSPPSSVNNRLDWDLRDTLGRMPYSVGVPFTEDVKLNAEGVEIQLRVTFFPGGHTAAPKDHVSLWVSPLQGLEDRSYLCTVDGSSEQRGSGESILHFPRVEVFGEISLSVCDARRADGPGRLERLSDGCTDGTAQA